MPRRKLVEPAAPVQQVEEQVSPEAEQFSKDLDQRLERLSADQLLSEYLKIKDYLAQQAKVFAEFCKPYKDQQTQLENQMLDMLNRLGGDGRQSIKTESGTFFRVTIVTPKISDREKYLDFVLDNWDTIGNGMLQLGAPKKEAIDAYSRENNGALPAGVETSTFVNLNVRRA